MDRREKGQNEGNCRYDGLSMEKKNESHRETER